MIAPTTVTLTAITKRGAPCRKSRWKRAPSAQPSRHWPALEASTGVAERLMSAAVSGIATASEPSTNALGTFSTIATKPPATVAAISSAYPPDENTIVPGT